MVDASGVEDDADRIESVEAIPEKKEEVKQAVPLAYDMDSGVLLNNHEELSEALRNIRRTDSDGEEVGDDEEEEDDDEDDEEEGEEESDDADDGEILNPQPTFDEDDDEDNEDEEEGDESDEEAGESRPLKRQNPLRIEEEAEEEFEEPQPKKKVKKTPVLTQVSERGDTMLSSYTKFRASLTKMGTNSDRIKLINSLCQKITTGTDANRQGKMKSLFQFAVLSIVRGDVTDGDSGAESIVGTLYTICDKCKSINEMMALVLADYVDEPISIEYCRLFRIIVSLYSMSDFKNTIGLPAQLIAVKMITRIRARNVEDIALGLLMCAILINSVRLSGRYIPEVYVYLLSVIACALSDEERPKKIFPSFRLFKGILDVDENEEKLNVESPTPGGLVYTAVRLMQQCTRVKFNYAAAAEVFAPFHIINELPLDEKIKSEAQADLGRVCAGERVTLSRKKKVKVLQLYEPKIEERGSSRKQRDLERLKKQVKDEKRGAKRKIISDSKRIQEEKNKKKEAFDKQRKDRTKFILNQLANQEGDVKKTKKTKINLFPDG